MTKEKCWVLDAMNKKYKIKCALLCALVSFFIAVSAFQVLADVKAGDVIDKSNWKKAEGLLLPSMLELVKKGDLIMNIGDLNYDPKNFMHLSIIDPAACQRNLESYTISADDELIDKATGKYPKVFNGGLPFPAADPKDPKFGLMLAYNQEFQRYAVEATIFQGRTIWIGEGGYEREISTRFMEFGNYYHSKTVPNPEGFARQTIFTIVAPYDLQGTSIMTWQRLGSKLDSNFAYIPAIRRIRRTSPASRSDAMFGSDLTTDDFAVFNGKMESMNWNYLETKEMLVPFLTKDIIPFHAQADGSFKVADTGWEGVKFGYMVDGWKGAPWCPTNWIWKKRKVYVIEMIPKDKYYNYGRSIMVMDADTYSFIAKENYDRSGALWKIIMNSIAVEKSQNGKFQMVDPQGGTVALDLKRNHASVVTGTTPESESIFHANNDPNDFTMAGFMKFCK